jgi:hypothetical protein
MEEFPPEVAGCTAFIQTLQPVTPVGLASCPPATYGASSEVC